MRMEVVAIGEALVDLGAKAGPVNVEQLGDLLTRLAVVYGRYVNAKEQR